MSDPIVGVVNVTAPSPARAPWGYALAFIGVVLFAVNGTVAKGILLAGIGPLQLSALRITGAAVLLMMAAALITPADLRIRLRELPLLAGYGIAGVALTQVLYFIAITRMPIAVALVIEFSAPVMVALWVRIVQHQPVRRLVWLALALAMLGLTLVTDLWQGPTLDPVGVLAAAGAAVSLALYFIGGEHYVRERSPVATAAWAMTAGAVAMLVLAPPWTVHWQQLTAPIGADVLPWLAGPLWLSVGWVIVLGTFLPFLVTFTALRHLPARQAVVIAMLEPVVAATIAYLVLGEVITALQMLGGLLVLVGVVLADTARLLPAAPGGHSHPPRTADHPPPAVP